MTLQTNFYSWINKRCIFFYAFFPFGRICAYTSVVGVWLLFCSTSCVWVPEGSDLSRHRLCENFLCCLPGCKQGHQTSNELKAICPMLLMSSPASEYCPSYSSSTLSMKLTSVSQDGFLSMLVQNRALTSMGLLAQMQLAAGSVLLTGRSIEPHQKDLPRAARLCPRSQLSCTSEDAWGSCLCIPSSDSHPNTANLRRWHGAYQE